MSNELSQDPRFLKLPVWVQNEVVQLEASKNRAEKALALAKSQLGEEHGMRIQVDPYGAGIPLGDRSTIRFYTETPEKGKHVQWVDLSTRTKDGAIRVACSETAVIVPQAGNAFQIEVRDFR